MSGERGRLSPEVLAAIEARAAELAAAAPLPTEEQFAQLRRWFGPRADAQAPARSDAA